MNKLLIFIIAITITLAIAGRNYSELKAQLASDKHIRDRVVMLRGDIGGCSGIQVVAPSKRVYILTARHCQKISSVGIIIAILDNGKSEQVKIIEISKDSDLMLLSSVNNDSIPIADKVEVHEHIHTLTHGAMKPTYRTDGEMLRLENVDVMTGPVFTPQEEKECNSAPNQKTINTIFGSYCIVNLNLNAMTAWVVGGSSGGPVLNDKGELVGIVSASNGPFSSAVTLEDIHSFLANR